MALSENKQILIDAIMLGDLHIKESANIARMIESNYITESDAKDLLDAVEYLPAKEARNLLWEEYSKYRSQDVQLLTEDEFSDLRNNALILEANDETDGIMSPAMKTMLLGSTVPQLCAMYLLLDQQKREDFKRNLSDLARATGQKYNNVQHFLRILPRWEGGARFRFDGEALPSFRRADDGSRWKNLFATREGGRWTPNVSKIAITAIISILLTAGITALVIYLKRYFSAAEKEIRKSCSKYPQGTKEYRKCELTLRIKSCDEVISKLQQAMPACKQKNNPYKCLNSIQKNIYMWQVRRREYETRLKRIID